MKKPEIDLLAEKYDFAAESIKKTLSQMLSEIEQGKNISRENVKKYETEIVTLNSCYESVVSFLRQTFMQEVLPPEGSSIPEYVSAYHSAKDLKLQAITDVLERFVQVRSDVKTYASALQPSHKKAEKALTALRTANANGTLDFSEEFCQTDGMALFLRILEIQDADMDTEETMAMIQKITEYEYYSTAVQFGLLRRKYTLPENTEQNIPEPEETVSEEAQTPEELWKKAGILHPEPLCFHVEDEKLKKYQSDKSRKFGVKDFQSDMKKFKLVPALVTCKDFNGISAKMLSNLLNMKISDSQTMCSKLESLGYFISYEVEGYDKLYVLSPQKGKQVFLHKESSAFLKLPKMKNIQEFGETVEETANIALTRILRAKTFSLLKEIKPECKIGNSATCTNDECFVQVFDDFFEKNKNLAFINIISENPEQYCCLTEAIKECSAEMVIVIGINRKHAEALAQWLSGYFETQVKAGKFLYLDDETGIYYQYPEHTPFDFSDDTEDKTKELTSQDTKEITQEHPAQELSEDFVQLEFTEGLYTPEETKLRGESDETQENLPLPENIPEESPEQTDSEEKLQDSAEEDSVSEDTSPPVFPEVHEHLEKEDLSEEQYQEYHQTCLQMIAEGKFYCASAYARVLSEEFTQFEDYGTQVAFAFNDPLAECSYNSDVIYEAYLEYPTDVSEILVIPAVLRNYFLDYCNYDNRLHALQDAVSSNRFLEENPPLRKLVYKLQEFKTKHHHGVDFYADYHLKDRKEMEEIFLAVKKEATVLYDNYIEEKIRERVPHKRLLETKKLLFGKKEDLACYLETVKNDDREALDLMKEYLSDVFVKEKCQISEYNIDVDKINKLIDKKWQEAGGKIIAEKKTSDLMGSLRSNVFNSVKKIASVLCKYVETVSFLSGEGEKEDNIDYQRIKPVLLKYISEAQAWYQNRQNQDDVFSAAAETAVCGTLEELRKRLDGSYDDTEKDYFYLDFLKNGYVLLDGDYMPVLDEIYEVPNLSVLSRIEKHFRSGGVSLEQRLQAILCGDDDYGSARLILSYLKKHPELVSNPELLNTNIEEALEYPSRDMENKRRNFIADVELAQSWGQINNTQEDMKEILIQIMERWYCWAIQTGNYGFFYKILSEIRTKIKQDAQFRAVELENQLKLFISEHPEWKEDEKISQAVEKIRYRIQVQNYAAAEDLLNRVIDNDLDTGIIDFEKDYLEEFLEEYTLNAEKAGRADKSMPFSISKHNKDTKGASRIIDNWPKGGTASPVKIKELLTAFGFNVDEVVAKEPIQGKEHFQVSLVRPQNGRKGNYTHPVSAFGSEAEEKGFRVVCIFGKMTASRLIDMFKEIGNTRHTMILLDFSLGQAERKELARKAKVEYSGKTFIVIDRIVAVYLARHYSETAVSRMLMAVTMPFAAYQPYAMEAPVPPEMFMGRKYELEQIISPNGVNFVYGGRQLGKSALLKMAQKYTDMNEAGERAVFVEIKNLNYEEAALKISRELYDVGIIREEQITKNWQELSRTLKNRLLRPEPEQEEIPYLLLLLDEAEDFIESSEPVEFAPLDELKDLQNNGEGHFKFVIAGLRNIIRFKKEDALKNNKVLTKLTALTVMPFKTAEARQLLEVPLYYLGFRFPNDSKTEMLISNIFGTTNYFPGLLQLYCSKLIEALRKEYAGYDELESPPYIIREEHIKKALADSTLTKEIREKFFITLRVGNDDYYYLIALLAAYHYHNNISQDGCSAKEIREIAESYSISKISSMTDDKIDALMEEMRELNVFQQVKKGRYRFSTRNFREMMGKVQKIDDEIVEYGIRDGG